MAPAAALAKGATGGDRTLIDGIVKGVALGSAGLGALVAKTQTGYVRGYASYILGGVVVALAIVLGFRL